MSAFFVDLWESIFTPGPTPTILKATNATFAALQLVLLSLFCATYSIHFVILSLLCAGLWWSINWFAAELVAQQKRDRREAAARAAAEAEAKSTTNDGGSDTEVEASAVDEQSKRRTANVEPLEPVGELKRRVDAPAGALSQSSVSTEDEWEKVSESGKDK